MTKTNLEAFHNYLRTVESPTHFITWQYYVMISACLGRRVWFQGGDKKPQEEGKPSGALFPNIFVWNVAGPGVGKSVPCSMVNAILKHAIIEQKQADGSYKTKPLVNLLPTSGSLQGILTSMERCSEVITVDEKTAYLHTSAALLLPGEAGIMFKRDSEDLTTFFTEMFDCGDYNSELVSKKAYNFKNGCLTISLCAVPEWIARHVTDSLIDTGFTSRFIFLFGRRHRFRTTIQSFDAPDQQADILRIINHIKKLGGVYGRVKLTQEAFEFFDHWCHHVRDNLAKRVNKDHKLASYYERKKVHLVKVAILVHFGESTDLLLQKSSFVKALNLLESAELDMHYALTSRANNPMAIVVEEMREQLATRVRMTYKQLLAECLFAGDAATIEKSIDLLLRIDELETVMEDGKTFYKLKIRREPSRISTDSTPPASNNGQVLTPCVSRRLSDEGSQCIAEIEAEMQQEMEKSGQNSDEEL